MFLNSADQLTAFALEMQKYGVRPELEIFDAGMIANELRLVQYNQVSGHLHFDFVMGVPGAIPDTVEHLLFLVHQLPKMLLGSCRDWKISIAHAYIRNCFGWTCAKDNIYYRKGQLATNRQLVERVENR